MFNGASNFAKEVDFAFMFTLVVSVFFLVLITLLMIYFVVKYNRKKNPKDINVHSNVFLEVTWTIIPTILVLIMFWYGWMGYVDISEAHKDTLNIDVTAQRCKSCFLHPKVSY